MDQAYGFEQAAAPAQARRGKGLRLWLALLAITFALGAVAMYYLVQDRPGGSLLSSVAGTFGLRSDRPDPALAQAGDAASSLPASRPSAATAQVAAAVERVEAVVEQQGGLDARLAAMEQRLTRLDLQSQAAQGNAARAEGLLIAFAARRALERGAPLGYLADQLRLRFGDAQPNSVQTVIEASRNPVTLDQLLARLDGLAPALAGDPADENVLSWLGRELSQAFVVRSEDTPSPAAGQRLERARMFLESSRPEAAVQEIRNLPNAAAARDWIADAIRFANAQRALEQLETAAVLEPRALRDGDGQAVAPRAPTG